MFVGKCAIKEAVLWPNLTLSIVSGPPPLTGWCLLLLSAERNGSTAAACSRMEGGWQTNSRSNQDEKVNPPYLQLTAGRATYNSGFQLCYIIGRPPDVFVGYGCESQSENTFCQGSDPTRCVVSFIQKYSSHLFIYKNRRPTSSLSSQHIVNL